jgi:signal transduction histidine kinase
MFNAPLSVLLRYDGDGIATLLATADGYLDPIGRNWPVASDSSAIAQVCRTGLPARADYTRPAQGPIAAAARAVGARSAVGVPVVVDRTLWGVMAVGSRETEPLPPDFEGRLAQFTELLATAIANAEGRAELDASRARIVATADATRRRIERDLHDGAQQHLVGLALNLRVARELAASDPDRAGQLFDELADDIHGAIDQVRELAHGIYPPLLADRGLPEAVRAALTRSPTRGFVDCDGVGRYPAEVETTVYFCCVEAIQNAGKHAGDGARVSVRIWEDDSTLLFEVADDGAGFDAAAAPAGAGLTNMRDRVGAHGGQVRVEAARGAGTRVVGGVPLRAQ